MTRNRQAITGLALLIMGASPLQAQTARGFDDPVVEIKPLGGRLLPVPSPNQPLPPRPDLTGVPNLLDPKVAAELAAKNVADAKTQVTDAPVVVPQSLAATQHRQPTAATALTGPASPTGPIDDPLAAPIGKPATPAQ